MSDATTTPEEQAAAAAAEAAQAAEAAKTGAEESTDKTHTDTTGAESADANKTEQTDEDLAWLAEKGIKPEDPDFNKKVAKAYREAEKAMHEATTAKAAATAGKSIQDSVAKDDNVKTIDEAAGEDPEKVQMKRDMTEMRFFMDHGDEIAPAQRKAVEAEIVAVAKEFPKLAADFDLETMYAIAKSRRSAADIEAARRTGRDEAKAEIARASTQQTSKGNAAGATTTKGADPIAEGFKAALQD